MSYNFPDEFIFLSTQTASSSASLSFTSLITSTYPVYFIKIRSLIPATDATNLLLTFSTDNGSTYLSTNYLWSNYHITSGGAPTQTKSASDSSIHVCETASSTSTNNGINMEFYCFGFGTAVVPAIMGNTGTTAINAIKFAMSAGNIASGTISLYGMTI